MKFVLLLAVFAIGALAICPPDPSKPQPEVIHYPSLSDEAKLTHVIGSVIDILSHPDDFDGRVDWFQIIARDFLGDTKLHERLQPIYPKFDKLLVALKIIVDGDTAKLINLVARITNETSAASLT
jgi:hypothetical protein